MIEDIRNINPDPIKPGDAELEVVKLKERIHLISKATNDCIYDWNLMTKKVWWSESLSQHHKYPSEITETDIQWWEDKIHPDERAALIQSTQKVFDEKLDNWSGEYRFKRADGSFVDILDRGFITYDNDQNPVHWIGSMTDITESKKSEDKIGKTLEQLQESIIATGVGLWDWNLQTNEVYMSPVWKKQIGYEDDELQGGVELFTSRVHPDDAKYLEESMKEMLSGKREKFVSEYRFRHKDGSYRWIMGRATIKQDVNGKSVHLFGSHLDITERKLAEENLKYSLALNEAILNSVHNGILVVDQQGKVLKTNTKFAELWHIPQSLLEQGDDKKLLDFVLGQLANPNEFIATVSELYSKPESKTLDLIAFSDGRIFERFSKPFYLNSEPKGRIWSFLDITKQKLAEEKIKILVHAIESTDECVGITDKDFNLVFVNQAVLPTYGYKKEELIGLPISIIHSDNNTAEVSNELFSSLAKKQSWKGEVLNKRKDGSDFPVLLTATPLLDEKGEIIGSVGITKDITEMKRKEVEIFLKNKELYKLNAEKDKFFTIIAHDLKGPFNGFLGLTEILATESDQMTMKEIQEFSAMLNKSASNLYELLGNLLKWASIQKGLIISAPESFKLLLRISENLILVRNSALKKGVKLDFDIPEDLTVFIDPNILDGIIRNLTNNAVKFTPKGGNISITAKSTSGNFVEISIKDTGIGMSKQIIDNLFKLDVNTSRKGTEGESSTGLGLIICKDLIEKLGGELWVKSKEGEGAEFHFTLCNN